MRWLVLALSGCGWIGDADEAARWDVDDDGISRPEDCDDDDRDVGLPRTFFADDDGDGHGDPDAIRSACAPPPGFVEDGGDCDDGDALVHPGADERCDGLDDDCDGDADEGLAEVESFRDGDGDGYGGASVTGCEPPYGYVAQGGDCDDADPARHPGADEVFDAVDNDCDGEFDCDDPDQLDETATFFPDVDGDGYGDASAEGVVTCEPGALVADATDCDDRSAAINPSTEWFLDDDHDGFGAGAPWLSCLEPADYVANPWDCDDADPGRSPLAMEVCDGGVDNDCNALADDADPFLQGAPRYHQDLDGDTFGDPVVFVTLCAPPVGGPYDGWVRDALDCRDDDPARNPAAVERCNELDDDCDERVDDADDDLDPASALTWHADTDGDGFGDPVATTTACLRPPDATDDATDCDDADAVRYPGAPELCDARDNDCDGAADEELPSWWADADGDGWGSTPTESGTCAPQAPTDVPRSGDCRDDDPAIHPVADERCDGTDNDCDGQTDDLDPDAVDLVAFHPDGDTDGSGDPDVVVRACTAPAGHVADGTDCDDGDAAVNPSADEVCGGTDEDCDALVDEDDPSVTGTVTWYVDADTDGAGDPTSAILSCDAPPNAVADGSDCDDGDRAVHPGAVEVCSGEDEDCDALVDDLDPDVDLTTGAPTFVDGDGDGFGDLENPPSCAVPPGSSAAGDDCDDADVTRYPGAPELCDGLDNDCDGLADEELPSWWPDADLDGYGDAAVAPVVQCVVPGFVLNGDDCDDARADVHPGVDEVCDGEDDDCDGAIDGYDAGLVAPAWYTDADGDGAGDPASGEALCPEELGPSSVASAGDCDDGDPAIGPSAPELCNGRDDDCDGAADDLDPEGATDALVIHDDADGDGFGDPATARAACVAPAGTVADGQDCADDDWKIKPGALETCDGTDEDCDGAVDDADPDVVDGPCAPVDTGDTGVADTGDTGAPCGPGPLVTLVVDPPAGEAGTTLHGATVGATGGLAPLEVEIDWGDGTVRAYGASLTDAHTYAGEGTSTVAATARDACGALGAATTAVVVSAPGALLAVTTGADEADGEVFGGPWLGTGLSLREALALSESEPGRQVVTFAPGLGIASVGIGLPSLVDPAGTRLVGRPDVVIDGSAGGQLEIAGPDAELHGLLLRDFAEGTGAIRLAAGSAGARLVGGAIDGSLLALRVDAPSDVAGTVFTGNGGPGLDVQIEVWAPATFTGVTVAESGSGAFAILGTGSGTRIVGSVIRDNLWGIHLLNSGGGADGVVLDDDTIVDHADQGVWLEPQADGLVLRNCVVAFNGTGIEGDDAQLALLDGDLFFGNGVDCTPCTPAGLSVDPLFANFAAGDVSLLPGSPAIDVGVATGFDRNGILPGDWNGAGPDVGAVESP